MRWYFIPYTTELELHKQMYASGSPVHTAHGLLYLQMQTVSGCHYYILLMHTIFVCL